MTESRVIERPVVRRSWSLAARHVAGLPDALVARLRRPEGLLDGGVMLKDGDRCTVVRLDLEGGPWVVKRFNRKGIAHTAGHTVLRSRAAWCWRNAGRLRAAGLCTPEAVACVERRLGALRLESWLVTRFVPGRILLHYARDPATPREDLERVADAFGAIWRTLGELRAGHDDMKATNFIVAEDGRLWMLDLDGMRLGLAAPRFARARRADRRRFMRNWQDLPEAAALFRGRIDTP